MKRKLIAILLSAAMIVTMLPVAAMAEEPLLVKYKITVAQNDYVSLYPISKNEATTKNEVMFEIASGTDVKVFAYAKAAYEVKQVYYQVSDGAKQAAVYENDTWNFTMPEGPVELSVTCEKKASVALSAEVKSRIMLWYEYYSGGNFDNNEYKEIVENIGCWAADKDGTISTTFGLVGPIYAVLQYLGDNGKAKLLDEMMAKTLFEWLVFLDYCIYDRAVYIEETQELSTTEAAELANSIKVLFSSRANMREALQTGDKERIIYVMLSQYPAVMDKMKKLTNKDTDDEIFALFKSYLCKSAKEKEDYETRIKNLGAAISSLQSTISKMEKDSKADKEQIAALKLELESLKAEYESYKQKYNDEAVVVAPKLKRTTITTSKAKATVTVKWETVEGAQTYKIYYKKAGSKAQYKTVDATKVSATIKGLNKGKNYTFKVRSEFKQDGVSSTSAWSKAVTVKL